ncbi:MAG TPA: PEP/pyruvate-binding domain-containing protein [Chloroflexia bacterium]|nr:PEP/pyruvate-binding domain-containing protein [Chloroflexia bacterium]
MNILWFGDPACQDVLLVGAKATNLSRLAADFCVPEGFCITTRAYEDAVGDADPQDGPLLSEALREEITEAYIKLGVQCGSDELPVAVRSSGLGEDSSGAAFAGVHDTFLNVRGASRVLSAVADCWRSASSPIALHYRQRQGLGTQPVKIAVVVQRLVPADASAVVFSANPVTGSRDEVMINASWGLGESIVAGTVTPDTFIVRKPQTLTSSDIAEKECMTVLAGAGTREVDVPPHLRLRPSLTPEQIIETARLAGELELHMGWPVDLECAYHESKLYLLQCRPITTLK